MKRRTFIGLAGAGGAIAALVSLRLFTTTFERAAREIILSDLNFLKLDDKGVRDFVAAYAKEKSSNYKWAVKGYQLLGIGSSHSGKIHQMVTSYLLSTDFFRRGMDESKVVKYVGLYDPYTRPCLHPFNHIRTS